jgi:hypothetical protein
MVCICLSSIITYSDTSSSPHQSHEHSDYRTGMAIVPIDMTHPHIDIYYLRNFEMMSCFCRHPHLSVFFAYCNVLYFFFPPVLLETSVLFVCCYFKAR